ncbi:MAG TPA: trypsin-like peptidase domain-containing protein [Terracidiphilus sp.]|nr:trypsin-like peptidase domain-containing protein [Terracidiphilus sp.]
MRGTLLLSALVSVASLGASQSVDIGKQIYSSSQESVFLVYLNDSTGTPTALGSAFLVRPRILITNAHVVDSGTPVLAVGPVRIPLKVLRIDKVHDLAEMSVDVDLTSKPLSLSTEHVIPGEQIFAIGNPEGLEKSISQGIISGLRKKDGNDFIQISSPISHGSSGGPILNTKGEVVGVAAAFLDQGQNLNFAIPVSYVKALLEAKDEPRIAFNLNESLAHAAELLDQKGKTQYSDEPDSDYRKLSDELLQTVQEIVKSSDNPTALTKVACYGTHDFDLIDLGIEAARKLVKQTPTSNNRALLAYVLFDRAQYADITAEFSAAGSDNQKQARAQQNQFLTEASATAALTVQAAHGNDLLLADFVLGGANNSHGDIANAIALHTRVAVGDAEICDIDLTEQSIRNLVNENDAAKRPEEAEKWFKDYAARYTPEAYEWDSEGDRRAAVNDNATAANAYEQAARNTYYSYDYCYATRSNYAQFPRNDDAILKDGKLCIDASAKNTVKGNEKYFSDAVPIVDNLLAIVLDDRGVYQEALDYVKESIRARPDYADAMDTEATIYFHQQRFPECESVETAAIRAADGKYPYMQFRLGTCYFSEQNWPMAENSFRIAAEADKTDAASAFNLGLCLRRQGAENDAKIWFREALTRNPDKELREKIASALQ